MARGLGRLCGSSWPGVLLALMALGLTFGRAHPASPAIHEGVASCAGLACHGRSVASGLVVRQNELITWQDESSQAGEHSRAWRVLSQPRALAIGARLGIEAPRRAPLCLGCHADPARAVGAKFELSDGVGCEACHGGAGGWLASHYTVGASHAVNVARGMIALDQPRVRAGVCLDCHFGAAGEGQFVSHRIMSAGHPRLSFELDLFSTLQRHYDLAASHARRGLAAPAGNIEVASGVKTWAVGQAMALERSLSLYASPRGQEGVFPEFYFFDCHACHRAISDDPAARPTFAINPGRPIPLAMPPYNDENLIMLRAAARVAAPRLAARFESDSHAFHLALARDRGAATRAAAQLAKTSGALADAFSGATFQRAQTFQVLDAVLAQAQEGRYTDYEGAAQAVMAVDTLLGSLTAAGEVDAARAGAVRPAIESAYAQARDPNTFRPADFRLTFERIAGAIRSLQ